MTFIELLKKVIITGGKTPTDKSLRESQIQIIFEKHFNNLILKVYQNGFVSYSAIIGNKKHTTVFSLDKVNWTYRFVDGTTVTIPKEKYMHIDAEIVLASYGEQRLAHNNEAREMISEEKSEKLQTQYSAAIPDFSDEIIEKLDTVSRLQSALKKLTDLQYKSITLYYYEQLKQEEIAKILGTSRSNVQFHLRQAYKKLEKLL